MARRPRIQLAGAIYHVMSRGNRKARIFEDDEDRSLFLRLVARIVRRYDVRVYALCLMPNHYHLVLETPRGNVSDAMRQLNGVFTQATNSRHERTGHLFEGRFRSIIVQRQDSLCRVVRYVALNPVEASLAKKAEDWPWSTYRYSIGVAPCPTWLANDWMLTAFDAATMREAQRAFRTEVEMLPRKRSRIDWHAVAVGTKEFEAALELAASLRRRRRLLPREARPHIRPSLDSIFAEPKTRPERDAAIALAHVSHGYRLAEISRHLGFQPSMASDVLRRRARQGLQDAT